MFGKLFASTFTGSMVGAGLNVFAVWSYVIANTRFDGFIEINPALLAAVMGCDVDEIRAALAYLSSPDPHSRSKKYEGRRLIQEGPFLFSVPNYKEYRTIKDTGDRREYMREYMRDYRAGKQEEFTDVNTKLTHLNGKQSKPVLAQVEEEVREEEVSSTFVDSSSLRSEESTHSASCSEDAARETGAQNSPEPEATEAVAGAPGKNGREVSPARTVFDAWRAILGHPTAAFDESRRKLLVSRLKNFTVEQLCRVPLGVKNSPWHMGENPLKKKYHEFSVLYANADKVEFFLALAETEGVESESDHNAIIAAQEACGCYEMGGLRKVGSKYLLCDHKAVIPVSESKESVVWPPPVQ